MQKIIFFIFLFFTNIYANNIQIALSSNTVYVFEKLVVKFNQTNPNIKIDTTVSSSGKLSAMIIANAPYDIFLSANMEYANYIYKHNLSLSKPIVYAQGTLTLLSYKKLDFSQGLDILKNKKIKKIAIANEKIAPYGKATKEALINANLYSDLKAKFVYGESIGQTLFYTLNATNIGIVASSALKSDRLKHLKKYENYIQIPTNLYTPIKQGMVMLNKAKNNQEVKKFYKFLQSDDAKVIFKEFGYII
jgi:molybdate transport system substrate-binding protein